jgi:hypothetical protein
MGDLRGAFRGPLLAVVLPGLAVACGSSAGPASSGTGGDASGGAAGGGLSSATGGGSGPGGGSGRPGSGGSAAGGAPGGSTAGDVARRLGRGAHFLVGMGNDLSNDHNMDGAYTLGVTLDLHYAYMVGLPGQGGWPDWNSGGTFVNILSDSADAHGVTPMYTLYAMASNGDGNLSGLAQTDFMTAYWQGVRLLFQRIAVFGKPALVHVEPDFWAYAQQMSGGDPSKTRVLVSGLVPECASLTDDLAGLGHCILQLGRTLAPRAVIGFHASRWAGTPAAMVTFLRAVGAADADVIVQDMLDRDAGCFEAHTDPNCQRNDGPWYWDEGNQTSPNFHDYLSWAKAIGDGLGKPILWWQVPFGVPSATMGGTAGHYRDNRVHYIFNHLSEFVAAGGLGVTFGTGAGNQTYITSDGGQFKNAVTAYFAAPTPLP